MNTGLKTADKSELIFPTELRIKLSTAEYWSEKELLALCCGVPPKEYGERDEIAPEAYRKAAKDKIHEAIHSGILRAAKNPDAGTAEMLYGGVWRIAPSHAVRWALPIFPNFPEWLSFSLLTSIYEMQEAEKKTAGRYTLKEAATQIAMTGEIVEEQILKHLLIAAEKGALPTYLPNSKLKNEAPHHPDRYRPPSINYEECYWDDLNKLLKDVAPRISFSFPNPNTQADSIQIEKINKPLPKPIPTQRLQEQQILEWLVNNGYGPKSLPKPLGRKGGPKATAWHAMKSNKQLFRTKVVFEKAWERLRANGDIQDAE